MKILGIPRKLVYEKFYIHEIAAVNLLKIYLLKNAKKTCKPNNRDLNRDWIRKFWWKKFADLMKDKIEFQRSVWTIRTSTIKIFCENS